MNYTPWLLIVTLLAVTTSIVLQALLVAFLVPNGVDDSPTQTSTSTSVDINITSSTPTFTPTTPTCHTPPSYRMAGYAHTWFVLGDEFARGDGADASNYISLLAARSRSVSNVDPVIINAVGADTLNDLPRQVELVRQSATYRSLIDSPRPALVFVSYGAGLLQQQADRGSQDAALSIVMEHYGSLVGSNGTGLIPTDRTSQFYVVLIPHPDPTYGGVSVPVECANCPSLNHPTLSSRLAHKEIYSSLVLFQRQLAQRNGWAWLDTDAALGSYAWPNAANCEASAFADCYTYNSYGHALLSDALWPCIITLPK